MRLPPALLPSIALALAACGSIGAAASSSTSPGVFGAMRTGHSLTGDIHLLAGFHSRFLPDDRDLVVYLPPSYATAPARRYPVLYMQDGQNLFDAATAFMGNEWHLDETAQSLIEHGLLQDLIIVGIDNTPRRIFEYTWVPDPTVSGGGGGARYARMVAREIKPLIDRTYRTLPDRDHTAIMGSSLGGLISFFVGRHDPATFGDIGMMSPSIWWDGREVVSEAPHLPTDLKIWLDMGTREGSGPQDYQANLSDARALEAALEKRGYELGRNLGYFEDPGASHDEASWGARVWRPLEFFFGTR